MGFKPQLRQPIPCLGSQERYSSSRVELGRTRNLCVLSVSAVSLSCLVPACPRWGSRNNNLAFCCGRRRNSNIMPDACQARPNMPQIKILSGRNPLGRGGGRASAALPLLDDVATSPASRRLASARPALAPKCQLIIARTLSEVWLPRSGISWRCSRLPAGLPARSLSR